MPQTCACAFGDRGCEDRDWGILGGGGEGWGEGERRSRGLGEFIGTERRIGVGGFLWA